MALTCDLSRSPVAKAFYFACNLFDVLVGPIGSGKTFTCIQRIYRHVLEQPPSPDGTAYVRVLVLRNTYSQLRDTTLKSWLTIFPESVFGVYQIVAKEHNWTMRHPTLGHPIKVEVLFRALDGPEDVRNLLSLELSFAYINELREIDREIISQLRGRLGRYPSMALGGPRYSGLIADSNCWPRDHFLSTWFGVNGETPPEGFVLWKQPSGLSPAAENIQNLPRGYYESFCAGADPYDIACFVRAEWVQQRGQLPVYADFRHDDHVRPFELDPTVPFHIGCDGGLNSAFAVGQRTPHGWRVSDELLFLNGGFDDAVGRLRQIVSQPQYQGLRFGGVYFDPANVARSALTANTVPGILRAAGFSPALPAPGGNAIMVRVGAVNAAFRASEKGRDGILIHPRCKELIRACQGEYHYRQIKGAHGRVSESPEKNAASHIADALQYFLLGKGGGRALLGGGNGIAESEFVEACERRNATFWDPMQ